MSFQEIILGIMVGWLVVLTTGLILILKFFNRLSAGAKGEDLKKVLDRVLVTQIKNSKDLTRIDKEIRKLEEQGTLHVQKVGLIRFNPFRETGGKHSFSLALLNAKNTGVVLTGLHTRERTRLYIKAIKKGKSEHELSFEEKRALTKAQERG